MLLFLELGQWFRGKYFSSVGFRLCSARKYLRSCFYYIILKFDHTRWASIHMWLSRMHESFLPEWSAQNSPAFAYWREAICLCCWRYVIVIWTFFISHNNFCIEIASAQARWCSAKTTVVDSYLGLLRPTHSSSSSSSDLQPIAAKFAPISLYSNFSLSIYWHKFQTNNNTNNSNKIKRMWKVDRNKNGRK